MDESLLSRLNKYIIKTENLCWIWSGTYTGKTPITTINKKSKLVRKVLYEMYKNKPSNNYLIAVCKNHKCVNPDHIMNREEILWNNINKNTQSGCWEWTGSKRGGYGYYKINCKAKSIHRLMYERYKGEIPKGMNVCHTCDNPSCCNPEHLWIGTQIQNIHDCVNKKRDNKLKGEAHLRAKITEQQVLDIKQKYKSGIKTKIICHILNLPYSTVRKICTNETWKHIKV